jgi:hypothetical protein
VAAFIVFVVTRVLPILPESLADKDVDARLVVPTEPRAGHTPAQAA